MTVTSTKNTRTRRTPEQIVADLQAKIAEVQARAVAREVKQSPEGKALLAAIRAVEKASRIAQEAGDRAMLAALEAARAPLAGRLEEMGVGQRKGRKARTGRRAVRSQE